MGFELQENIEPDYSYINTNNSTKKYHKNDNFIEFLKAIPEGVTEQEWEIKNKFSKLWNCGKKLWKYNLS